MARLMKKLAKHAASVRKAAGMFSRLSKMGGIRVGPVQCAEDRAATRAVRHAVYVREKAFLTSGELFDGFDERALILNAHDEGLPVGTLRVTSSDHGTLEILQMHPELAPLLPKGARIMEVSRLMVVRTHRGLRATLPMFRQVFREFLSSGGDALILSCAKSLIPYYRDMLGFRLLSETPLHHAKLRGLQDYPMILELPVVLRELNWRRLPVWASISPAWALRAIVLTGKRKLAELFAGSPQRTVGAL